MVYGHGKQVPFTLQLNDSQRNQVVAAIAGYTKTGMRSLSEEPINTEQFKLNIYSMAEVLMQLVEGDVANEGNTALADAVRMFAGIYRCRRDKESK